MILRLVPICALFILASCSEAPIPKKQEGAKVTKTEPAVDAEFRTEQKSLEEAADAAAKLVEADAKAEIDALDAE
jgi:hypothetical protein